MTRLLSIKHGREFITAYAYKGEFDDDPEDVRLYHVFMRNSQVWATEIDVVLPLKNILLPFQRGDLLDSKDCFILVTPKTLFLWLGQSCPHLARMAAIRILKRLEVLKV